MVLLFCLEKVSICIQKKKKMWGILAAVMAYIIWGVLPLYWKMAGDVPASEILAYRIIWSFVFMVVIIAILGKTREVWTEIISILKRPRLLLAITIASVLITANWFIFIFTVNDGHVISASLGYYINPLVNVLLATVFLKEKLSRGEALAVLSAAIGVLILAIHQGVFPWAAISMAVTFGLYGLIKKLVPISVWGGLTIETLIMTPFALIFFTLFCTGCVHEIWLRHKPRSLRSRRCHCNPTTIIRNQRQADFLRHARLHPIHWANINADTRRLCIP